MNGTLISQPPGGGGSGSSVTNGGPACVETVVKQQARRTRTRRMFTTTLLACDGLNHSGSYQRISACCEPRCGTATNNAFRSGTNSPVRAPSAVSTLVEVL